MSSSSKGIRESLKLSRYEFILDKFDIEDQSFLSWMSPNAIINSFNALLTEGVDAQRIVDYALTHPDEWTKGHKKKLTKKLIDSRAQLHTFIKLFDAYQFSFDTYLERCLDNEYSLEEIVENLNANGLFSEDVCTHLLGLGYNPEELLFLIDRKSVETNFDVFLNAGIDINTLLNKIRNPDWYLEKGIYELLEKGADPILILMGFDIQTEDLFCHKNGAKRLFDYLLSNNIAGLKHYLSDYGYNNFDEYDLFLLVCFLTGYFKYLQDYQ